MTVAPALTPRRIAAVLAIVAAAVVLVNQRDVGIARDETVYMSAGARYAEWWGGLATFQHGISAASIRATFGGANGGPNNPEHPPLMKLLAGASHALFHDAVPIFDELTAFRLPSAMLAGVLVWLVFMMTCELWGLAAAVIAAFCLMTLPRAVFHAGLACFDAPIMTLWFATIYAYWRALGTKAARFPWQVGAMWGLALATKHTALLLPLAMAPHYAVVAWRTRNWLHAWRVVVALVVVAPLVVIAPWPWLWLDPIDHVRGWIAFHLRHVHYNFEYLGRNWNAPPFPWHVAIVTTLFTVPVATLVAAAMGVGVWIRSWRSQGGGPADRAPVALLALSAAASIGPFFLRSTPIFGAEKHWMPVLPTICIAAGVGAAWAARAVSAAWRRISPRVALFVVGGALAVAGATETVVARPYALTWYNALAGGAPGGADFGMNRQYWGVAARGILPVIAEQPPAPVYTHDAAPAWGWYRRLGVLPRGYPDAGWEGQGVSNSQLALVIAEKHFRRHDYLIWNQYGTVAPIVVLRAGGVPIVTLYRRRPSTGSQGGTAGSGADH